MNVEVEIRADIESFDEVKPKIEKIGKFIKKIHQIDTYFNAPHRDFRQNWEYLRLRNNDNKEFSFDYHFCRKSEGGYSCTEEDETKISDPEALKKILESLGFKVLVIVDKTRELWDCGDFEISLDFVYGLGYFIEIEAKKDFGNVEEAKKACYKFLNDLDIKYKESKELGYPDLLLNKEAKLYN